MKIHCETKTSGNTINISITKKQTKIINTQLIKIQDSQNIDSIYTQLKSALDGREKRNRTTFVLPANRLIELCKCHEQNTKALQQQRAEALKITGVSTRNTSINSFTLTLAQYHEQRSQNTDTPFNTTVDEHMPIHEKMDKLFEQLISLKNMFSPNTETDSSHQNECDPLLAEQESKCSFGGCCPF